MNPVASQLAKGRPYAETSWGAFGDGWLWVATSGDGPTPPIPPTPPTPSADNRIGGTGAIRRSPTTHRAAR